MATAQTPGVLSTARGWWKEGLARAGFWPTARSFSKALWEFLLESTPAQRRQRYGDAEYDWDYHVDTTSATVNWRDRLLGQFHSAYQPTDPVLFREMMASLDFDFSKFTLIDVGSGKGRVLLMAADYPFRQVVGVELLPDLHQVAEKNLIAYRSESQKCFALKSVCADVCKFSLPAEPLLLYLFNPLPETELTQLMSNVEDSLHENPRDVYVLYHNPLLETVLEKHATFRKIKGTHQYSLFCHSA